GGNSDVETQNPPPPGGPGPKISGTVKAPNGDVALLQPSVLERFAGLALSEAQALTGDFVPVGSGIEVILSHRNNDGVENFIARTFTNSAGQYAFNFPPDTTQDTCRFIVAAGAMRAFVTAATVPPGVDITPLTEAAVRMVLAVGGFNLCAYTTQDL